MDNKIITINVEQRDCYKNVDLKNSGMLLKRYFKLLNIDILNHHINLLDVGGGSGYFTKAVHDYLKRKGYKVTAYVLDTMRYSNWDSKDNDVIFCEGSVENVEEYFSGLKFDLIFCNKVFHHFVTNTYSETLLMLEICMNKLKNQLSINGKLCILDYFYNGLIIDKFPSWMIYKCTSQKNELLIRFFKKMGANPSESGVCFQSEKMWYRQINRCNLDIIEFERRPIFPMKLMKQIVFLSHKPIEDCIFICSLK